MEKNNQTEIDFNKTKFHGGTYDQSIDEERLTGQVKKIYQVLKTGRKYDINELSELSGVSVISISKRASDLRLYHGLNIKCERIKKGLFSYQFVGFLTDKEKQDLKLKKIKPIGNPALFGEYMRSIYAYAKKPSQEAYDAIAISERAWRDNFISEIQNS